MDELALRLFKNMELRESRRGERQDYKERFKVLQNANNSKEIVPFSRFKDFPLEIQRYIWKISLPGPRFLCPYSVEMPAGDPYPYFNHPESKFLESTLVYTTPQPGDPPWLNFDKQYRVPNPIALSVCRISREVALSKYQLCFGTSQIYADLTTDILFFHGFSQDIMEFLAEWLDIWFFRGNDRQTNTPPPIIADLLRVENFGYQCENGYESYDPARTDERGSYGNFLKEAHLCFYRSLKTVFLCDTVGFAVEDEPREPGQMEFAEAPGMNEWEEKESYQIAMRIAQGLEEEKGCERPNPKVRFAPIKLSYNVPTLSEFLENPYA